MDEQLFYAKISHASIMYYLREVFDRPNLFITFIVLSIKFIYFEVLRVNILRQLKKTVYINRIL